MGKCKFPSPYGGELFLILLIHSILYGYTMFPSPYGDWLFLINL